LALLLFQINLEVEKVLKTPISLAKAFIERVTIPIVKASGSRSSKKFDCRRDRRLWFDLEMLTPTFSVGGG